MNGDISFVQSGKIFRFNDNTANIVHPLLPTGNYVIGVDAMGNMFLEKADAFPSPKKIYGNVLKHTKRIINTFMDRGSGTGVLLTGEKGSGKTLLAKNIVNEAAKMDIPTIIINQPYVGDGFNKFIQNISQPAVILFDEFEKVYNREQQEQMLTLLDGSFPSKKLFVLTCNDKWRIDEHMRNRPGRIYYSIEFDGLDPNFVREYCIDNLADKSHANKVVNFSSVFTKFNFDMLKALVEEMNRYNESPEEAAEILNTKVEYAGQDIYNVLLKYKNVVVENTDMSRWQGNPVLGRISLWYNTADEQTATAFDKAGITGPAIADEDSDVSIEFAPEHIVSIDPVAGTTTYTYGDHELILTRTKKKTFNVWRSNIF